MTKKKNDLKKYTFEFLSIFIGISLAFALDNWNENRNERESEKKILTEIKNGLELDLIDVRGNIDGHKMGIKACGYFRKLLDNKEVAKDSLNEYNFRLLRSFISIQNKSGYESLKSNGLKLVQNDSLRFQIITLYDFYYEILEKVEEGYLEMQFYPNHFTSFNELLAENLRFNDKGILEEIINPIKLSRKDKNDLLNRLMSIEMNRRYILKQYHDVEKNIIELIKSIESELN